MSNTVRVGILSYGMSGKVFHAPLLHVNPNFKISKVLQRSSNDVLKFFPYVQVVKNINDILNDPDIDLVLVNTPDPTHYEFTRAALEAGKHVVVEKPFVHETEEAETLIELANRKNRILTVFQNRRWDGDFLTVQHIIQSKVLGRLVTYEAHFDRYRNFIRDTWKEKSAFKTSNLYNLGSHLIDQALMLFGMPEAVYADLRKQRDGADVDDYFDLNLYYPSIKVTLKSGYLVREEGPRYMIHGTEGSFVKYGIDPQEEALTQGILPSAAGWGEEDKSKWGILNTTIDNVHFRETVETVPGSYPKFYELLYETLINGRALAVKPEESLNGLKIIRAAYESDEKRCAILTK
jgi:scyllo-inositol 2-dehydrogenase (NADP+)